MGCFYSVLTKTIKLFVETVTTSFKQFSDVLSNDLLMFNLAFKLFVETLFK